MKYQLPRVALLLVLAVSLSAQTREPDADPPQVLFEERVQVAAEGGALDVAFRNRGLEIVTPTQVVWIVDPNQTGVVAVASMPIEGTAKAGELMGRRGPNVLRSTAALAVSPLGFYALSDAGQLTVLGERSTDSLEVDRTLVAAMDVDVNANGLIFVLWGSRVDVYSTPPQQVLWTFELAEDVRPAVALSASAAGEVFVVGHGTQAVTVYELAETGNYERTRSVDAGTLEMESPSGIAVTPFMLLPVHEREGWADRDRFVVVSDASTGSLVALQREDLSFVGRWDLRRGNPGAAPGRLAVSNRGQIAYVDQRAAEAWVLPTQIMATMLSGADFRWRVLNPEQTMRVQGGDTLRVR